MASVTTIIFLKSIATTTNSSSSSVESTS